ncbi:hypothetical protein [Actinoplanes solisilvae]|uniref:hypothetical protein n=1 Tax=Actinoplanes solisilvae TaxID=2486853 RepID=UPI000FD9E0CF|nr:hypothetical protein [Actinoplanes solisilvae]
MPRIASQPASGLAGLIVVLPLTVAIVLAAGDRETALRVAGPIVTFGLPFLLMIAFWWDDWPGTLLPGRWPALTDTLATAAAAFVCTILGQAVVDRVDPAALVDPFPGAGHTATFPGTLPLAAGVAAAMLQLTLVYQGRPVRGLPKAVAGPAALAGCWIVGVAAYLLLVRGGAVDGASYGAWLAVLGVWQVVPYSTLRGWPMARVRRRHLAGNLFVLGGATVSYALVRLVAEPPRIAAVCGCVVATGLVVGLLLGSWPLDSLPPVAGRLAALGLVAALSALLYGLLRAGALGYSWRPGASTDDWVNFVAASALGPAIILHVAVWRRWPFHLGGQKETAWRGDRNRALDGN